MADLCWAKILTNIEYSYDFTLIWAGAFKSVRYFDFKGPKSWNIYAWNNGATMNRDLRPNHALDQKVDENRPPLFLKMGVCSLQLFDPSTSRASNNDPTAHEYYMRNIFMILAP